MQPVNRDDPPSRSSATSRSNGEVAPAINLISCAAMIAALAEYQQGIWFR
jgi:hypothetical protein